MDIDALIAGLEFASGAATTIMGKPTVNFFHLALASMEIDGQNAIIVLDDIDLDTGGGQCAGMLELVQKGKCRQSYVDTSDIKPSLVLESIRDLPTFLGCK